MSSARPPAPARDTGLPPGVRVGPLARRFVAFVIDSVVPAVAGSLISAGARGGSRSIMLVVLGVLLGLAWLVVFVQQLAVQAASPGMRVMKLQLVGFLDGRPVGWGRALLRWLVFAVLAATGLGLLLLLVSLLANLRHQGWHDRAANGVVIVARALAPRAPKAGTARAGAPSAAPAVRPEVPAQGPDHPSAPKPDARLTPPDVRVDAPSGAVGRVPVAVPAAVAGDPALGPELAPLAGEPSSTGTGARTGSGVGPAGATDGARRTVLDGWTAELDDGRAIVVRGLVLIGRNPQPGEGEADAELVKLRDESRTVSKTHLALGVDDAGLFVVDRGSTNGSTITPPGGPTVPVGAFHATSVSDGSVVSIGDHWLRIRRSGD